MASFCSSWLWVRFEDDFLIDFYDFCCFGEKYVPCLVWKHPILKTRRRLGGNIENSKAPQGIKVGPQNPHASHLGGENEHVNEI